MAIAIYPRPAATNDLARQPLIVRPLNAGNGLSSTGTPQAKGAPAVKNPLQRKPFVSR